MLYLFFKHGVAGAGAVPFFTAPAPAKKGGFGSTTLISAVLIYSRYWYLYFYDFWSAAVTQDKYAYLTRNLYYKYLFFRLEKVEAGLRPSSLIFH